MTMPSKNSVYGGLQAARLSGKVAHCKILSADPLKRQYRIQIISHDTAINNIVMDEVTQMNSAGTVEGDESSHVAEVDSIAVCLFVGQKPYIIGFVTMPTGGKKKLPDSIENIGNSDDNAGAIPGSTSGKKESIDIGDHILITRGQNKIILRRSGMIEIESTKVCRTNYYPNGNLINTLCRNYEFTSDGVSEIHHTHSDKEAKENPTYFRARYKDQIDAKNAVVIERGSITPSVPEMIERHIVGSPPTEKTAGVVEKPVWIMQQKNTGDRETSINPGKPVPDQAGAAWYQHIEPDGKYTETINAETHFQEILPSGQHTININKGAIKVVARPDGSVSILTSKGGHTIEIDATGNVDIKYAMNFKIKGKGGEYLSMASGQVAFGGPTVDVVKMVQDILQTLVETRCLGWKMPLTTLPKWLLLLAQYTPVVKGGY